MRCAIFVLAVLMTGDVTLSKTLVVPGGYPTIQQAVDAAMDGDVVLVRPGTYVENIDFLGKTITVKSEIGPKLTLIDGGKPVHPDRGSVAVFQGGEGAGSILEGFTLTNGSGFQVSGLQGHRAGGGIFCGADGALSDITSNIIAGNTAAWSGGGIFCLASSPTLANNLITENTAKAWGGGISCDYASLEITGNTLYGNTTEQAGGGMRLYLSFAQVASSVFWGNDAPTGPQASLMLHSTLTIDHSDVDGGKALVHVEPGSILDWGPGMIDADPLFVHPAGGDLHLTFSSPCRDVGDNAAVTGPTDFEGDPRIAHGTVDMGADEFHRHLYCMGDATPGGNVEVKCVGLPGTSPVGLSIGSGVLDPPLPSMWGDWYLQFPIIGPIGLPPVPADGVLIIPGTIPGAPPAPYSIPMQALIGAELTNLCVLDIE